VEEKERKLRAEERTIQMKEKKGGGMDGEVEEGIQSQSSGNGGFRSPTPFSSGILWLFGRGEEAFSTTSFHMLRFKKLSPGTQPRCSARPRRGKRRRQSSLEATTREASGD
jgi:hypothetical protein